MALGHEREVLRYWEGRVVGRGEAGYGTQQLIVVMEIRVRVNGSAWQAY